MSLEKDITEIKNILEAGEMVFKPASDENIHNRNKQYYKSGIKTIVDNDSVLVLEIYNKEAAIEYGKGTLWGTARNNLDNTFDHFMYTLGVTIYYVLPKNGNDKDKIIVLVKEDGSTTYNDYSDHFISPSVAQNALKKFGVII